MYKTVLYHSHHVSFFFFFAHRYIHTYDVNTRFFSFRCHDFVVDEFLHILTQCTKLLDHSFSFRCTDLLDGIFSLPWPDSVFEIMETPFYSFVPDSVLRVTILDCAAAPVFEIVGYCFLVCRCSKLLDNSFSCCCSKGRNSIQLTESPDSPSSVFSSRCQ